MERGHRDGGQQDHDDEYQWSALHSTEYYDEAVTRLHRGYDETVADTFVPDVLTAIRVPDKVAETKHRFRRSHHETHCWTGCWSIDTGGTVCGADRRRRESSRRRLENTGRGDSLVGASHRRKGAGGSV